MRRRKLRPPRHRGGRRSELLAGVLECGWRATGTGVAARRLGGTPRSSACRPRAARGGSLLARRARKAMARSPDRGLAHARLAPAGAPPYAYPESGRAASAADPSAVSPSRRRRAAHLDSCRRTGRAQVTDCCKALVFRCDYGRAEDDGFRPSRMRPGLWATHRPPAPRMRSARAAASSCGCRLSEQQLSPEGGSAAR
jgi:hypothetical protein